jgi:hypothetical protein
MKSRIRGYKGFIYVLLFGFFAMTAIQAQIPQGLKIEFVSGDAGPGQDLMYVTIAADGSGKFERSVDFTIAEHTPFTLSSQQMEGIWQSIQNNGFFQLDELYNDDSVPDRNYAALYVATSDDAHSVRVRNQQVPAFDAITGVINGHLPEEARVHYDMSPPSEIIQRDVCDIGFPGKINFPSHIKRGAEQRLNSFSFSSQTDVTPHSGSVVGYKYTLQEAVAAGLVSISGKGDYFGDGARITVDNTDPSKVTKNVVSVQLHLEFYGEHATPANVNRIKNAIEQRWKGTTSDGKQVVTEVISRANAATNSPPGTTGYHQIKLVGDGRSYVNKVIEVNKETGGGEWRTEGSQLDEMYAHEAGHLLGFDDVYNDYVKQPDGTWKSGDQSLTSEQWAQLYKDRNETDLTIEQLKEWADNMPVNSSTSIPMEGHKGDLMADKSGGLSTSHFDELAAKAGLIVEVRPGDILVNKDGDNQNLINTRSQNIFTENGDSKTLEGLWVACIDAHLGIPSADDVFDVAPHLSQWRGIEAATHLLKLVDYINANDLYCGLDFITQFAIWRITDNQYDEFTSEYIDSLLASAGIVVGDRMLDFPRLISPANENPSTGTVTPYQLFILNSEGVLTTPGTGVTLTGTLMVPELDGFSTEFSWALISKPPASEATLSVIGMNTGILDDFPSSSISFTPDVRGIYGFELTVDISTEGLPNIVVPPKKVSVTAADNFTETFESGALAGGMFYWNTGGTVPWEISGENSHTGQYTARSGKIGDEEHSTMEVSVIVPGNSSVSFALRVSSERDFDYLRFFIDDQLQDEWSGDVDWTAVSYPLPAGERRLKWEYEKDWAFAEGYDHAWIDDIFFPVSITGLPNESALPTEYRLENNFPNPFNPVTVIRFAIPVSGSVNLKVYDILGREVAVLIDNDFYSAGWYEIPFDASNLPSGGYFYRIESGKFHQTRAMMLVR